MTDTDASLLAKLEQIALGFEDHGSHYTVNAAKELRTFADALRRSGEALRRLQEEKSNLQMDYDMAYTRNMHFRHEIQQLQEQITRQSGAEGTE